jgi:hypothetical protein
MKTSLLRSLMPLALAFTTSPLLAGQFGDFYYWSTPTEVTVYAYTGAGTSVTIPSSIGGLPVTAIGKSAFYGNSTVTDVTIPSSVRTLEDYAFWFCLALTNITIPGSVTSIGDGAFQSCTALPTISIPESVTNLPGSAFWGCTALSKNTNGYSQVSGYKSHSVNWLFL